MSRRIGASITWLLVGMIQILIVMIAVPYYAVTMHRPTRSTSSPPSYPPSLTLVPRNEQPPPS